MLGLLNSHFHLEQLKLEYESQAIATKNLHLFMEAGGIDNNTGEALAKTFEDGTDRISGIMDQLQSHRLDK